MKTKVDDELAQETAVQAVSTAPIMPPSTSDDYFQSVVINGLLAILKDQSLSSQHHTVIEAIMSMFKTQGLRCVSFLPQVASPCLHSSLVKVY